MRLTGARESVSAHQIAPDGAIVFLISDQPLAHLIFGASAQEPAGRSLQNGSPPTAGQQMMRNKFMQLPVECRRCSMSAR